MVRVAVVQATPVVLDGPASVEKACGLIAEAAAGGAKLIALPEGFVPIMPRSCWGITTASSSPARGRAAPPAVGQRGGRQRAARGRSGRRRPPGRGLGRDRGQRARGWPPGTLWNSLLWFTPDGGLARRHRKLVPTMHERIFWGQGAGDDLGVVPAEFGRLGVICWENFMPAARQHLHRDGVDFYVAPTADDRDIWVAAMRTSPSRRAPSSSHPCSSSAPRTSPRTSRCARGARRLPRCPLHRWQRDLRPLGQPPGRPRARSRGDPVRRLRPRPDPGRPARTRHRRPLRATRPERV